MCERGIGNAAAEIHGKQQSDDADDARLNDLSLAEAIHVKTHEECERDRKSDGKSSPGRFSQSVNDNQAESGECNHNDEQNRDARHES